MGTLEELEKRIRALEDFEAIRNLKARYGQTADDRFSIDPVKDKAKLDAKAKEMTGLFSEDAVLDGGALFPPRRGRKEIFEYFANPGFFKFGLHYFVKPSISVEGDKASARWYLLMAATTRDNAAVWLGGFSDDKYVKVNNKWLVSYVKLTVLFLTPYDQGWALKKMLI